MRSRITVCPHCSQPFVDGARLTAGMFAYSAIEGFSIRDVPLRASMGLEELIGAIMEARGDTVTDDELAGILGSEAADVPGLIAVQISRLKQRIVAVNAEWPLRRTRGVGWRWGGPPVAPVEQRHANDGKCRVSRPAAQPSCSGQRKFAVPAEPLFSQWLLNRAPISSSAALPRG